MKKILPITIFCALTFIACTNDEPQLEEDYGCMERIIIPVTAHSVSNSDLPVINELFSKSGINNSNLRYARYQHDSLQTYYPPFAKKDSKVVRVDQYINGQRLFVGDMVYIFIENSFSSKSGHVTNGTSLDTSKKLSLPQLRKLFLNSIQQFDKAADKYKDTCFKAEFGYYNLSLGTGNTNEQIVKAWRVTPKNKVYPSEYPEAYYQDNGKLIVYDNGIRTFSN
ncbi:MAG TPA: hypothetical protein VGE79_05885 [Niastella sp.]